MQIYVMDSDYEVLRQLETVINENPKRKAGCFTNMRSLLEAVGRQAPDAVLIDFDEPNASFAVNTIRGVNPDTEIVLMTKDKKRTIALFELGLNGYLLKPIDNDKAEEQLFRLEHPLLAKLRPNRSCIDRAKNG